MSYNRRLFLAKSVCSSLFLITPSITKASSNVNSDVNKLELTTRQDGKRKFSISLNPGLIGVDRNITQKKIIELAHTYGFESVSVLIHDCLKQSDQQLEELLKDMSNHNLGFGLSSLPIEFRKDKESYQKGLDELPAIAKVLKKIGANRMMTWIMSNHDQLNYLQNFRLHSVRLREIAGILKDYNIRLGLEYVGPKSIWSGSKYPFIHTMAETKELIAAIGHTNVGFHLDTAHWFTSGEDINDLKTLTNREIIGCDLNDAIMGIGWEEQPGYQRELPVATGVIDTKSFLEVLVSVGYDGPIQAEPFNETLNKMDDEQAIMKTAQAMKMACSLVE